MGVVRSRWGGHVAQVVAVLGRPVSALFGGEVLGRVHAEALRRKHLAATIVMRRGGVRVRVVRALERRERLGGVVVREALVWVKAGICRKPFGSHPRSVAS